MRAKTSSEADVIGLNAVNHKLLCVDEPSWLLPLH